MVFPLFVLVQGSDNGGERLAACKQSRLSDKFSYLADEIILQIFFRLEQDPRNWAVLACVCKTFKTLIRTVCIKTLPSELEGDVDSASFYNITFGCPGLIHSGVVPESTTYGPGHVNTTHQFSTQIQGLRSGRDSEGTESLSSSWSMFDDLNFKTYRVTQTLGIGEGSNNEIVTVPTCQCMDCKSKSYKPHLSSGDWMLSREQGGKFLASKFKSDILYISNWPGCMHIENNRTYVLFRGVFKNFKESKVWRLINDENRRAVIFKCAYCTCRQMWEMHSIPCLNKVFGWQYDGEPMVRAYVCENGHVSGARTDWDVCERRKPVWGVPSFT